MTTTRFATCTETTALGLDVATDASTLAYSRLEAWTPGTRRSDSLKAPSSRRNR
jgi:hypothetical protein